MGRGGGAATSPTPRFVFTPCRLVFKNPEPVIKVFANGGALRPPPTPFGLQENRTINKTCESNT